jgi:hypothetical protein
MPDTSRKIPTLDIKLSDAATYPEWVVSIEAYLDLMPVRDMDYGLWDIVMGTYLRLSEEATKLIPLKSHNREKPAKMLGVEIE